MQRIVRQRYRMYPNFTQAMYLPALLGACRAVYNAFLREAFQDYRRSKTAERFKMSFRKHSMYEIVTLVSALKNQPPEREWMSKFPAWTLQNAANDGKNAFQNWWDNHQNRPKYKKRGKDEAGARFLKPKEGFKVERLTRRKSRVYLGAKMGWITFRDTRPDLPLDASSITIIREPSGKYYISFVVQQEIAPPKQYGTTFAADMGVVDLLAWVNSDGERGKIPAQRNYRRAERKLKKHHNNLSRALKGSKNREKARQELALQHEKVRNLRLDQYRKIASHIARDNQGVIFETLSVKNMMKNRRLAKSVQDAAFGILIQAVVNACERNGTSFQQIDRWKPTTKICSQCDTKYDNIPLDVRDWVCTTCDAHLDRDWNAAANIMLAGGTTESLNACGERVRETALCQKPALHETGTHQKTITTV